MRGFAVLVGADDATTQRLRVLLDALSLSQDRCTFFSLDEAKKLAITASRPDSDIVPIKDEAHVLAIFGLAGQGWPSPVAEAIPRTHEYLAAQAGLESQL